MKKCLSLCFYILFVTFQISGQVFFESRITNGFIDKNPSFATKLISNYGLNYFEFLTFERWSFVNTSHICVLKMGENSPLDSIIYLTPNGTINKNPSIAYNFYELTKAMVVWQTYNNGKWDIYGSAYLQGVWSLPFPVDTSSGNKCKPCIINIDNTTLPLFGIAYQKENDIIFKRFNAELKQSIYEENLTSTDTSVCRNPILTKSDYQEGKCYVCYEKQKPDGNYAIYYRVSGGYPYNWSNPDTLAYMGNNQNVKTMSSFENSESFSFESNRSGKWGIYQTYWTYSSGWRFLQSLISVSQTSQYYNYSSFSYPLITDAWAVYNTVNKKTNDSSKILFSSGTGFSNPFHIVSIGDSSKSSVLSIGNGVFIPYFFLRVWLVYSKDSAGYSILYALGTTFSPSKIIKIGSEIPKGYSLKQNYPNPFNPRTVIKFEVASGFPQKTFGNDRIVLKIFDALGREVETLVNEALQPGTYSVDWNASEFPSGVYYYRLKSNDFTETKRMTLIK